MVSFCQLNVRIRHYTCDYTRPCLFTVVPVAKSNKTKPTKPYKDFPLFPHASGQWAKKIRGRLVYFGVWAEPDLAVAKYLSERDYLQAGLAPPPEADGTTLAQLCNRFLAAKKERVHSGELELSLIHI